jgi:hypothetical protein
MIFAGMKDLVLSYREVPVGPIITHQGRRFLSPGTLDGLPTRPLNGIELDQESNEY